MYKVIHLVVGPFEQGLGTSPVECLPVECEQSDGATSALYRKDRVSQSAPDAGSCVRSVEAVKTLVSVFD